LKIFGKHRRVTNICDNSTVFVHDIEWHGGAVVRAGIAEASGRAAKASAKASASASASEPHVCVESGGG
jgi:hypothetical protein